jgi:AbiJ-like protein/abortive infection Abi-like protein
MANTPSTQLRPLIAAVLYQVKSYTLPSVCERYGLEPGDGEEAFSSKRGYVMRRLEKLSDERVLSIAKAVASDYPDDKLQRAIETLEREGRLVSDVTRYNLAEALIGCDLGGKRDLLELLRKHFPDIDRKESTYRNFGESLADDILRHAVQNDDWDSAKILEQVGFLTCSQARLFQFLEDVLHPVRRDQGSQDALVALLNPILRRDGYCLTSSGKISGYPVYRLRETTPTGTLPADALISKSLISFDESGVHANWQKALDRRTADPGGAITAAKTLLETVCKHILEEAKISYGDNDDLPKLYALTAECLKLAPSQHTEKVFKSILGNCQSVVGNLATIRNKLGDSHGQGKRHSRPLPRHAELAVNLAGSMAMFLVATWNARRV